MYKAAERGELPCVRVGRMLRFKPDEIRATVLGPASANLGAQTDWAAK
ncbi:MAG: hypothetical protein QM704_12340 [Anaeromyxobacteraceae bacterium]